MDCHTHKKHEIKCPSNKMISQYDTNMLTGALGCSVLYDTNMLTGPLGCSVLYDTNMLTGALGWLDGQHGGV